MDGLINLLEPLTRNKIFLKIVNFPPLWKLLEDFTGANRCKTRLYPSVFKIQEGRLLDFGCSVGNLTPSFSGFDYVGVDIDPIAINGAKRRFKDKDKISFYCINVLKERLPEEVIRDGFDHILFGSTAHHIEPKELSPVIDKLLTYLKPTGVLHFFDMISQPETDVFTTRLFTRIDQGKWIRTLPEYEQFFSLTKYNILENRVIKSPYDWFIKMHDYLYLAIGPSRVQKP